MVGRVLVHGGRDARAELVATGHAAQVAGLVDERPLHERGVPDRHLHRDDAARASTEDDDIAQAELQEQPGRVIGVLGGATARPVFPAAAERPAPVIRHHGVTGDPLGDRAPALGILGAAGDEEDRRAGPADLGVKCRAVHVVEARDARWGVGQGVRSGERATPGMGPV
jgi:hypothetical protein